MLSRKVEEINKPLLSCGLRAQRNFPNHCIIQPKIHQTSEILGHQKCTPQILATMSSWQLCQFPNLHKTTPNPGHASPLQQTAQGQLSVSAILSGSWGQKGKTQHEQVWLQGGSWNEDHLLMNYSSGIPYTTCQMSQPTMDPFWFHCHSYAPRFLWPGDLPIHFLRKLVMCWVLTKCSTFSWVMWKMPVNLFRSFFSNFFFRIAKNNIEMSTTLLPPKPSKTSFRDFRGIRPIYLEPQKCPASNQPHPYKWFWQITFGLLIWGFLYLAICNPLKKLDS